MAFAFDHRTSHRQEKDGPPRARRPRRPVCSTCRFLLLRLLFSGGDLRLRFPDQFCQLFLALCLRFRVDVPGHALAIDDGGVTALPQVVIDLANASGAWFAPLSLTGLEGTGDGFLGHELLSGFRFGSPDPPVDFVRRALPHGVGDVGVGVQGGGAGHMADDGAQGLDVHAMLQGGGGEGVPQIMEPQALALRPFQHRLEPLSDGGRVQRRVLFYRGGEHPSGVDSFLVGF